MSKIPTEIGRISDISITVKIMGHDVESRPAKVPSHK